MVVGRSRLLNVLLVLLILLVALFLAQMLWQLLSGFADILLLFLLGWLVSFILNPAVAQLSQHPIPTRLLCMIAPSVGPERARRWSEFQLSRGVAVAIIYLGLVLVILLAVALLVPATVIQLSQLASHLPEYTAHVPTLAMWAQDQLARLGLRFNVEDTVRTGLGSLQNVAATLIQNALGILTSLLSFLANLFFVLILGFYFTLDGPRVRQSVLYVIPARYHDEIRFFARSVDRTFGGFIRGQLIQALLVGIGTAVAMALLGLNFVLVASLFAGVFMLIPLVGPFLALIPPLLVVSIQSPGLAVWLLLALFIYQFAIVNVLMPRMLSEAVGLHPLLVFAAILVSIKVAGFWGAFFGIPVAGVLWAMLEFFFAEWQKGRAVDAK